MPVTFYPNQRLSVGGTELILVQSANVDFSITRQEVFEFGSAFATDYVQTDAATVALNFEYALATGAGATSNLNALGLNNIGNIISDSEGKNYVITGAGTLSVPSGVINSYSVNAAIGAVPTVSIGVAALNATYSANSAATAARNSSTIGGAVTPQIITLKDGSTEMSARNVTLTVDIPRQYVYKLGSLTPIANITNGAAKVTVESEIILGVDPTDIDSDATKTLNIAIGGSNSYTANNMKLVSFNTRATTNEVYVATCRWEGIIKSSADLTLGG